MNRGDFERFRGFQSGQALGQDALPDEGGPTSSRLVAVGGSGRDRQPRNWLRGGHTSSFKARAAPSATCGHVRSGLAAVCRLNPPFRSTITGRPRLAAFSQVTAVKTAQSALRRELCAINGG